jgi:molybdate transport system substrate-binding protein
MGWKNKLAQQITVLSITLIFAFPAMADNLQIVAGGGYKKPILAVIQAYQAHTNQSIEASFGNMRQIISQATASSQIALVIGDKKFLEKESFLGDFHTLGQGKLVIAWAHNSHAILQAKDLTDSTVSRIAHPDIKKAVYGQAAIEWMTSQHLLDILEGKLIQTATVPQVSAYLVAREIDAGFINLTDAIGLGDKIAGYTKLDTGYTPITIVAGIVHGHENDPQVKDFLQFLTLETAKHIFEEYGM